jgi:phosphopantetheine--protein transferase-like protein
MDERTTLKQVVAELYQTTPATIDSRFSLNQLRFTTSAGRGVLAAAIRRRLGVYRPEAFTAAHFGQLESAVLGVPLDETSAEHVASAPPAVQPSSDRASGNAAADALSLGVDVELIENMPDADDYWTAEFYQGHFTPAEIAYCVRQEEPRAHFAARWCAKEALGKCDASFLSADPVTIQVNVIDSGRPVLERISNGAAHRLPFALSLSHTRIMAVAVVAAARAAA